jgi:hypothetical protein
VYTSQEVINHYALKGITLSEAGMSRIRRLKDNELKEFQDADPKAKRSREGAYPELERSPMR